MSQKELPHTETLVIHHLHWNGPFSIEDIKKKGWEDHPGIYQIYGSHATEGENTLLYIGLNKTELGTRLSAHKKWLRKEFDRPKVYLGRLVDEEKVKQTALEREPSDQGGIESPLQGYPFLDEAMGKNDETFKQALKEVEALLIYHCAPPYNSQNIQEPEFKVLPPKDASARLLYNTGFMGKLPVEVSTLWYDRWLHGST